MFEFHPMGRYMMPAHFGMPVIEGVPSLRYRDARGVEIHEVDGKLIRLTPDGHREVLYGA